MHGYVRRCSALPEFKIPVFIAYGNNRRQCLRRRVKVQRLPFRSSCPRTCWPLFRSAVWARFAGGLSAPRDIYRTDAKVQIGLHRMLATCITGLTWRASAFQFQDFPRAPSAGWASMTAPTRGSRSTRWSRVESSMFADMSSAAITWIPASCAQHETARPKRCRDGSGCRRTGRCLHALLTPPASRPGCRSITAAASHRLLVRRPASSSDGVDGHSAAASLHRVCGCGTIRRSAS